ncbi:hypothetical protein TSH7_05790 [Azospirillum sp. TSH7]|uniref:hypothetical protein n=1 Tax=unclassified Azospirillum TaxID=2630922 RepID=UPI000D613378|nr:MULTISPECIES: hypothetical protein [unclassified Azospirillum]PWC66647.1 hypothetical protein TSH7_05790 [Azospirillum sp. TSH7]PWC70510.1 hypothetical protein TSH20_06235 [Azospirillum sp. TSH20]
MTMRRTIIRTIFAAVLGTTMAAGGAAQAQMPTAAADTTVVLGQPLTLNLGAPPAGTDCATQATTLNAQALVLVANGQTIPGARASFGCSAKGELVGTASTSISGNGDDAAQRRAAWQTAFSGFFNLAGAKTLPVAFGPATGGIATAPKMVSIQGASDRDLGLAAIWFALVAALFLFAFFRHFGRTDAITPIAGVPMPANYRAPYSLARFQLLWWSGIVTASYVAILTITGSMDTITTGTMALMGIVGGTSVLAAFQDRRPSDDDTRRHQHAAAYLAAAAATPPDQTAMAASLAEVYPPSQGLLPDLLSDAAGYNIHRLQLLAWTGVLGITFLYEVTRTLGMPELSANLLALTGISNGTYFGFKMQEQQVPTPTGTA